MELTKDQSKRVHTENVISLESILQGRKNTALPEKRELQVIFLKCLPKKMSMKCK